jgi:hypothetical protein
MEYPKRTSLDLEHSNTLPSMFRLGDPNMTNEYMVTDKKFPIHVITWEPSVIDDKISEIAGWNKFLVAHSGDTQNYIAVPEDTRNAASVLAGVEAWSTEKEEIIDYFLSYTDKLFKNFGGIDVHAGFDNLGVIPSKRGNDFFIAPPHIISDNPLEISAWIESAARDLRSVLSGDPKKETLVRSFKTSIDKLISSGN